MLLALILCTMLHLILVAAIFPTLAILLALPLCIAALVGRATDEAEVAIEVEPEVAPRSRRPGRRVVRGALVSRRLRPSMNPRPMSSALAQQ